jgi:hypothetical protein
MNALEFRNELLYLGFRLDKELIVCRVHGREHEAAVRERDRWGRALARQRAHPSQVRKIKARRFTLAGLSRWEHVMLSAQHSSLP